MGFQTCRKATIVDALMTDILTMRDERDQTIKEKWELHNKLVAEKIRNKEITAYRDAYIHAYTMEVIKNVRYERENRAVC